MWLKQISVLGIFCAFAIAAATDGTFDSNGVKIHYVTEGQGEAIVFIHGWMGDATTWGRDSAGNAQLKPAPGYQQVALDCRGHGKSEKLYDPSRYGAEMAADVVGLLDHLKIKKAHLIGYSMGAFIAGKVAATHPERVLSLIYGGQAPLLIGEAGSSEIDVFAKAVEDGKGLGPYLIEVAPKDKPKPTLEQANALAALMFRGKDVKALAAAGLSFKGLEVTLGDLKKCTAPALFLFGSQESDTLKERVNKLHDALPGSEVKVVEGANHVTTLARPEFSSAIVEFLRAHKASKRADLERAPSRCRHKASP